MLGQDAISGGAIGAPAIQTGTGAFSLGIECAEKCCGSGDRPIGPCNEDNCPPTNWVGVMATVVDDSGTTTVPVSIVGTFSLGGGVTGFIVCTSVECDGLTYGPPHIVIQTAGGGLRYDSWCECTGGNCVTLVLTSLSCDPLMIEAEYHGFTDLTITFHE